MPSASSLACSSSAASKSAAGMSGSSSTVPSDPPACTTASTKKSPSAAHAGNASATSVEQSLEEMFSKDGGTGQKQAIPRQAGQHGTAPTTSTTQAEAAPREARLDHTTASESAPVLGKKRPNKSPKPRLRKKAGTVGPSAAPQQTRAATDVPKDAGSGGGASQKSMRIPSSQLGTDVANTDHASAEADALADLFGGQGARAPPESPSGCTESLHRSREKTIGSPKQDELQNREGAARGTARKQGSSSGDQLPNTYGPYSGSLSSSRTGGGGSSGKQKKGDGCKQISSDGDTESRQKVPTGGARPISQGSWMQPGGFGADGCGGVAGPGGGDVVIPDLDGEGEDEFI